MPAGFEPAMPALRRAGDPIGEIGFLWPLGHSITPTRVSYAARKEICQSVTVCPDMSGFYGVCTWPLMLAS